jgi:hypothetical protein
LSHGQACVIEEECAAGLHCHDGFCCHEEHTVGQGEACSLDEECADGLHCRFGVCHIIAFPHKTVEEIPSDFEECTTVMTPDGGYARLTSSQRAVDRVACPGGDFGYETAHLWDGTNANPWSQEFTFGVACQHVPSDAHCQALCKSVNAPVSLYRIKGGQDYATRGCACYSRLQELADDNKKDDYRLSTCATTTD